MFYQPKPKPPEPPLEKIEHVIKHQVMNYEGNTLVLSAIIEDLDLEWDDLKYITIYDRFSPADFPARPYNKIGYEVVYYRAIMIDNPGYDVELQEFEKEKLSYIENLKNYRGLLEKEIEKTQERAETDEAQLRLMISEVTDEIEGKQ